MEFASGSCSVQKFANRRKVEVAALTALTRRATVSLNIGTPKGASPGPKSKP